MASSKDMTVNKKDTGLALRRRMTVMMMKMGALMMESTAVEVMVMGIIFAFMKRAQGLRHTPALIISLYLGNQPVRQGASLAPPNR